MILPLSAKKVEIEDLPKPITLSITKMFGKEFEYNKAKVKEKHGKLIYEIDGEYDDYNYEILFDKDGKILKIEKEYDADKDE